MPYILALYETHSEMPPTHKNKTLKSRMAKITLGTEDSDDLKDHEASARSLTRFAYHICLAQPGVTRITSMPFIKSPQKQTRKKFQGQKSTDKDVLISQTTMAVSLLGGAEVSIPSIEGDVCTKGRFYTDGGSALKGERCLY